MGPAGAHAPEWLELRYCPVNAINRTADEYAHRAQCLRFTSATIEYIGPLAHASVRLTVRHFFLD